MPSKKDKAVNENRVIVETLLAADCNYFLFLRQFLVHLTIEEAAILQHLNNIAGAVKAHRKGGRFRCTVAQLEKGFYGRADRNVQTRVLNSLKAKQFIETRVKGVPPKREVRVNLSTIRQTLLEADAEDGQKSIDCNSSQLNRSDSSQSIYTREPNTKRTNTPLTPHAPLAPLAGAGRTGNPAGFVELKGEEASPHRRWADRLHKILCAAQKRIVECKRIETWAKAFRLLQTSLLPQDTAASRIDAVLDWYEKNTGAWTLNSAKGFHDNFAILENKMKGNGRHGKSTSPAAKPDAPLDPEVKEILKRVLALRNWHPRAEREMPQCVATSLANYREFQRRAIALRQAEEVHTKKIRGNTRDLALYYLLCSLRNEMWLGSVAELVVRWFARLSRKVDDWPDWSGSLGGREFSTDSQDFRDWGYGIAARAGGTRSWDKFMEEINGR